VRTDAAYSELGTVKYYAVAGMTVAMDDGQGITCDPCRRYLRWPLEAASRRRYLLTDHLGSVVAVTDEDGAILDQQRYLPFGRVRQNVGSITQTDLGFTGQRDMPLMGLMDYKARMYDPLLMRFIQPDTIIPNPADPQGWNRYAYVQNSPLVFTDPTGQFIVKDEECKQASCSGDPRFASHIIRENADEPEVWDTLTPDERSILGAAGIGPGFWQDMFFGNAQDIGGTWADPAVYLSAMLALVVTGVPQLVLTAAANACLGNMTCAGLVARSIGITVYRVWGGESTPFGRFWATVNPLSITNYAQRAGLPPNNSGAYLTIGRLHSMEGVTINSAPGIGLNPGGLMQYIITDPDTTVVVQQVCLVVPGIC
jgi:RHS repeat-associated protein